VEKGHSKLFERIKQYYPRLTRGQKALAEFITTHYDRAAFLTAAKLGQIVGLSESTVVRFASALGYNGFPELQEDLQEVVKNKLSTVERLELSADYMAQESVLKKVLQTDIENIRLTMEEVSESEFDSAVEAILDANRIYILGLRSAAALSNFLGYYLNLILQNVNIVNLGLSDIYEQLLPAKSGDLIIGISFPRYTRITVEAFEFAKNRGAKTIAITDSSLSPLGRKADFTLVAKSDMASFVDSFVAPMSVINALIIAVGMKEKSRISETLATLEEVWTHHKVYMAKERNDLLGFK
jgi:DNA-binding MurR/RpiR family transcriptional regulator